MIKRVLARLEDFFYRNILKNLLKLSRLGYGTIVTGAESGANFEHMYDNRPNGKFIIGRIIDKALLDLPSVKATRGRKEDIKRVLWNEIHNNKLMNKKTYVLDLASGGARYLRELVEEHRSGDVESICIDKDKKCVTLGKNLAAREQLSNIRFFRGDIFHLAHLKKISSQILWKPNVVIASGLFIYFNNEATGKMLREIYEFLPFEGLVIFSSYENLSSRKLMRKVASTSSGEEWTLYYRKPDYWRDLLHQIGYRQIFILRDQWQMNNICTARK
ncbi:MAG: class I SAM-dependent methyltransferase family protein [Planctomycetes bacterium]|nr:class I SAM-dependent methyltransferase family protein [Planctomycetota bacterium]